MFAFGVTSERQRFSEAGDPRESSSKRSKRGFQGSYLSGSNQIAGIQIEGMILFEGRVEDDKASAVIEWTGVL